MKVSYKAKNSSGEIYDGEIEVQDKFALYDALRAEGSTLVSYSENKSGISDRLEKLNSLLNRIKLQEKIMFARNLGAMLEAGLSLSRALSVMDRQTKNKKFKEVIKDLEDKISIGQSFGSALSNHNKVFPPIFISMVKAGEESGGLSDALKVVASQMEKTYLLKKKVKGAMTYPAIIVSLMLVVGVLMFIFVVPTLTATFVELEVELPLSTRAIIFVSDLLSNNSLASLVVLVGLGVGVWLAARTDKGKKFFEWSSLRIPVINGIVRETNSARTARTLASLLYAGVEVVQALSITKDVVQNSYFKKVIEEAELSIQKGSPMSEAFSKNEDVYPVLVGEMMSVGEETGKISDLLEQLAVFYENEVEQKTKNLSTIIEPFLMVIIGAGVGFFAVSMISPMYSLVSGI